MTSSIVTQQNSKRVLYIGGVADEVTEEILRAAFIPFGEVLEVMIPMDYQNKKNRGFGFVEFESREDCLAAQENMDKSELFGRVLTVNVARAKAMEKNKAVWEQNPDEYFQTEEEKKEWEARQAKKKEEEEEKEKAPKRPRVIETSLNS